jgi:hypothetical protein
MRIRIQTQQLKLMRIHTDPDSKPCYWDQFYAVVLNFSLLRRKAEDAAYFVDDIWLSGDGESDVSDEEESESNDDSSQSGEEEEGESSGDDEVHRYLLEVFRIRIGSGFNQVSGSGAGSAFGIRIRIQEVKMTHKN